MKWCWWGVMVLGILFCGTDGGLVSCGTLSCASVLQRGVISDVSCDGI